MSSGTGRPVGERGSATVWVVAASCVLAAVGVTAVLVGSAVVARHRAATAADLAALAAAERAVLGDREACGAADTVARANGAVLAGCRVGADAVVDVSVGLSVRLGPLGMRRAEARARAGPAPP